jgi:hypothetical protein
MQRKSLPPNHYLLALMASIVLSACVSAPTGPTITIMPREGKSFDEFKKDDDECRAFAAKSVQDGNAAALKEGAISTATGAAIGAAAGALYQGGSSKTSAPEPLLVWLVELR